MQKVSDGNAVNTEGLVLLITGRSKPFINDSMRYGQTLEPQARISYANKLKKAGHRNVKVEKCGLIIHPEHPFIAARNKKELKITIIHKWNMS